MEQTPHRREIFERELADLSRRYGRPIEQWVQISTPESPDGPAGFPLSSRRTAEVVLIVPRRRERVLVHTKNFYPSGVWRLPTGGLRRRESIERAVRRESLEEIGLAQQPTRFLFHIHFRWERSEKSFQSFGFLLSEAHGKIRSRDRREQISAFRDSDRRTIQGIAQRLERLRGSWTAWGRFRAVPHRALLAAWPPGGLNPGDAEDARS
jgi:ADP-ribose pyrophosphatase YjhB (NUDIX family)